MNFSNQTFLFTSSNVTFPFSALVNVNKGLYRSLALETVNGKKINVFFGSEMESALCGMLLEAIVKEGTKFQLPEDLRKKLAPVRVGYVQCRQVTIDT
jgi:hypothetical protein